MARINWGQLFKLPSDQRIAAVRAWVESHQPADVGYQPALRWLTRRERERETVARYRPTIERLAAEHAEQMKKTRSQKP